MTLPNQSPTNPDSIPEHPLLEVRDLRIRFELESGPLEVIDGVSFDLNRNEILCLVGESGSGKTVMMHALLGLLNVAPGIIGGSIVARFGGQTSDVLEGLPGYLRPSWVKGRQTVRKRAGWQRLYRSRMQTLLGRHLGLIFQNPRNALDPLMTVGEQILESVLSVEGNMGVEKAREEALSWIDRVHIDRPEEVYYLYPHQLSGGMCQRIAIAQILALRPTVLIADEPTTGLDVTIQAEILDLLLEVRRTYQLSIILITHDFEVVEQVADRIMVLFHGSLLEVGNADEILGRGVVLHPYTQELLRNVRVLEDLEGSKHSSTVLKPRRRLPGHRNEGRQGCIFVAHCPVAAASAALARVCQERVPEVAPLSRSHSVRCHEAPRLRIEEV